MIKKQKFGGLDIVKSQSKGMWSLSYLTCVDIILVTITFKFKSKQRNLVAFIVNTCRYNVIWKILLKVHSPV